MSEPLNTEYGDIKIEDRYAGSRWYSSEIEISNGCGVTLTIDSPDTKDEPEESEIVLGRRDRLDNYDAAMAYVELVKFGAELVRLLNAWNADAIAEQAQREAEESQLREEEEAARQQREDERAEIMMMELVGERVKVRHRGYKTMCYGEVYVVPLYGEDQRWRRPQEEGEEPSGYKPRIRYSDQGDTRDNGVGSYRRLDAKTERGWRTVWDDGKDDLPEYDRAVKLPQLKPYN